MRKRFSPKVTLAFGPTYEFYKLDQSDNLGKNIVMTPGNGLDPTTLYARQSFFGGKAGFVVDARDNPIMPQKGINWITTYRYLAGLNDQSRTFSQINTEFSFYLQIAKNRLVFADRLGGGTNFGGDFEFFQAQYLGNDEHLRGFRKYRFAGKSKIFNQAELRWAIANFKTYLFPASFGIFAFYDTGKIYDLNDDSNKWLNGYGGGIWIAPLKRLVLTFAYAASKEDKLPLIGLGFKF
jgi:outer membrane protein assembly factor BamA